MSVRDHRDKAEGRRHKARMPKPCDAKLGTRVHNNYEEQYEDEIPDIDKCPECGHFAEVEDLTDNQGVCYDCAQIAKFEAEHDNET